MSVHREALAIPFWSPVEVEAALRRAGISAERITAELPFLGVLLKRETDVELVKRAASRPRRPGF